MSVSYFRRVIALALLSAASQLLIGCGGGGSSRSEPPPAAAPPPQALTVADSLPVAGAVTVDPELRDATVSHLGFADLQVTVSGPCSAATVIRRQLEDLSNATFPELLDHKLRCTGLAANASVSIEVAGERANGDRYETELAFSTGVGSVQQLTDLDAVLSPRATIDALFDDYLANALLPELNLAAATEALLQAALSTLADDAWARLTDPGSIYGANARRVSYPSRDPQGNAADRLTGLVAAPDTSGAVTPRDQVIVLAHSTGSTPGDLDPTNAWYLLANVLAAQGYLVIAADNWGRGDTSDAAETYLLANRTAANSADFLQAVLADPRFASFLPDSSDIAVAIVGYSQGGHSALALWQLLTTQGPANLSVSEVYAGGGPYNLYRTFKGVLEQVDGRCGGAPYCRYVDDDTTIGFATDRILPGYLDYTDIALTAPEVIAGDALAPAFVTGFLDSEAAFDALKILLQQNSFTNLTNAAQIFGQGATRLFLYHSPFDRLVPEINTRELNDLLAPALAVEYLDSVCDSSTYETIFNLTEVVGVSHTLCGLSMIDDVVQRLR